MGGWARALRKGPRVRLVVVMRGAQPAPTRPQRRELQRLLLAAAPAALSSGALGIAGPRLRRLYLEITLRVERLDDSGRVEDEAKARLLAFFDPATGGRNGIGWTLGDGPTGDDVARALLDVPKMESIDASTLQEVLDDGTLAPWPDALRADELAWLTPAAMRFAFLAQERAA